MKRRKTQRARGRAPESGHGVAGASTLDASAAPHVVALVLNWCGEEDTAACVESLLESTCERLTVLLIDNGSPDGSGARLEARYPGLPFLQTGENLGYTGGNNRGFAWALEQGADYVLVINNDTVVEPDCIPSLLHAMQSAPHVGCVVPKILVHDAPDVLWYAGGDLRLERGTGVHRDLWRRDEGVTGRRERPCDVTFVTGCCILLTRQALERVQGFEESFFAYNEDVDLSWRLLGAGFRLVYEPRARLTHKVPYPPPEPSAFQIVQRDRNRRRFVALRLGLAARLRFALWFYPTRLAHLARYAARGDRSRAGAIWRGMVG